MTIAIITARGGSRRLPRKNMKLFCGIPLFAWAVIQAKTSRFIDAVFVSTDDDEIQDTAYRFGANVIRRPDWADANEAAANRPFIHAMKELKEHCPSFDTVVTMLPTTPLNLPGDIDAGITAYRKGGWHKIMPLIPQRETIILRKTHPEVGKVEIFDKTYAYLGESNAWLVTNPDWYINFNEQISDMDVDLNNIEKWGSREWPFVEAKYWQYADVDTIEEFEFAEVVMEHFILKGEVAKCYFDYADAMNVDLIAKKGTQLFDGRTGKWKIN